MSSTVVRAKAIVAPVSRELGLVEAELEKIFSSPIDLISAIGRHLATVKGKRIRPALVLLSAKIGNPDMASAIKVGVAIEVIHTATLVHDDSIDRSSLRRGLPTINRLWNDQVSVIMGDYLFCKAFRLLHESRLFEAAAILSRGSDTMTYGEMTQMDLRGRYDVSEEAYLAMVKHKTAALFASACEAGSMLGGLSDAEKIKLTKYGELIGTAFQIVDDILDFVGDQDLTGKPVGNDLRDCRVTLPLIVALRNGSRSDVAMIRGLIDSGRFEGSDWIEIVGFIQNNGGIDYSHDLARRLATEAAGCIADLRDCPAKNALILLADHVFARKN